MATAAPAKRHAFPDAAGEVVRARLVGASEACMNVPKNHKGCDHDDQYSE
jgi:hypothetical protein